MPTDENVSFVADGDTIYGTLTLPASMGGQPLPAALILAGSGPTDRNGNSPAIPGDVGTLRHFAATLAAAGVVSLRYDKLASGATGLGSYAAHPGDIGFGVFVDEARAGYNLLAARAEVDPARIMLFGHSEGGLIALVLAQHLQPAGPAALALAAPLSVRYLDLLRGQINGQYAAAVAMGQLSQDAADTVARELDEIVAALRTTGRLPNGITTPGLLRLFAGTTAFLVEADRHDPRAIAAQLPPTLPVLIMRGQKDEQVAQADVQALVAAFQTAGNAGIEYDELPDVDHVFKVVAGTPNPAQDYGNPDLPFSDEAEQDLARFVARVLGP